MAPGGFCKPAWNNPSLGYMDKVVFYRTQVTNCGAGFQLDACRADNLNYWVENSVRKTPLFMYVLKTNLCQDRLGTNIRTVEGKGVFCRLRTSPAPGGTCTPTPRPRLSPRMSRTWAR